MSESENSKTRIFLENFFGNQNELKLEDIEQGKGAAGVLLPWIKRLDSPEPLPTVVPHKFRDQAGTVRYNWYAIAHSGRELRDLGENLMAFVGPTWSTFRGERARLDPSNLLDSAVLNLSDGLAFKFTGDQQKIWQRLELMRQVVWESDKPLPVADIRPPGRVLRDFYIALQVQNRASAENALTVLQHQHGYDAINISFLRVQMLAEFEQWSELLETTNLSDLILIRRPVAVTEALIRSIYREELLHFEETDDFEGALQHFRREVLPRYGSIFLTRSGMRAPEVIKSFTLLAVSSEPPNYSLIDETINFEGLSEKDTKYIAQFSAFLPKKASEIDQAASTQTVQNDLLQAAKEKLWNGDYDSAFHLAVESPASAQRTQVLLTCAYELQTLESESIAVKAFDQLTNEEQYSLLAIRTTQVLIEKIIGSKSIASTEPSTAILPAVEPIPRNWIEWLDRVYVEPSWSRATNIARQGSIEWKFESFVEDPDNIDELVQKLSSYPSESATTLYDSLPYLLEFFRKDDKFPRRECEGIYYLLLDLLTISTNGGEDELTLFNELVFALLSLGMPEANYVEVLDNAEELWKNYLSPSNVNWVLDLIDSLIYYPSPKEDKRKSLLSFVVNSLTQFANRITADQWNFLGALVKDLRQEELLTIIEQYRRSVEPEDSSTTNILTYLHGKTITIYTLTESAAQRAKNLILSSCQNVTVNLSHDKVGSDKLRQWAKNSDIFIIVTWSAKHAATEFIEANRSNLPILRPLGKGSASIFNTLFSFIKDIKSDTGL